MQHLYYAIRTDLDPRANFGDDDDDGDENTSDDSSMVEDDENTDVLLEVYGDFGDIDSKKINSPPKEVSVPTPVQIDMDMEKRQAMIYSVFLRVFSTCSEGIINVAGNKLRQVIQKVLMEGNLDFSTMQFLMKNNFEIRDAKSKSEREILFEMEVIIKASVVYFVYLRDGSKFPGLLNNEEDLFTHYTYPEFQNLDGDEVRFLINFTNMMKIAITIIPPRFNKKLLLHVCAFLEGSRNEYITGGAQTLPTQRRVQIYEQESQVKPIPRPERRTNQLNPLSVEGMIPHGVRRYTCICGSSVVKRNRMKHERTFKHLRFLHSFPSNTSPTTSSTTSSSITSSSTTSSPTTTTTLTENNEVPEVPLNQCTSVPFVTQF
mmetsp:Transcript_8238/g.12291  ORF Transcript_8238/g.12291 Transcript_8238/m.12291 type:complete len:375 (-) Transcript_8238:425-1549(-)|eukprot:CAMPEP_0170074824 /NCGR_PEP_ID=MMETSP0019_2-20121128/12068_1 /TAXON_ID=98059 /ORGANISM="Dinobryon sp., Strain UTEXLB2267" /LENGTH=374 /DNA_ID=CAMNT_0010285393 /DNA_START=31 /DNA_END=1155 /DNA_ORIENTATION=+